MARDRGAEDTEVPISSLIDVIFLLIMFFVVTADMSNEAEKLNIELADSANMKPVLQMPGKRVTINVIREKARAAADPDAAVDGDDIGVIYIGADKVTPKMLRNELIKIKKSLGVGTVVILRTDEDVRHEYTALAIEEIKASGLRFVKISAEAVGGN